MLSLSALGALILLISSVVSRTTAQNDFFWASPIDGSFNETKWNIAAVCSFFDSNKNLSAARLTIGHF